MIRRIQWIILLAVSMVLGYGCTNSDDVVATGAATDSASLAQLQETYVKSVFAGDTGEFNVAVYYEAGAEPYTGPIGLTANQTWSITKTSLQALFQNHVGRVTTVPMAAGEMTPLPNQSKTSWSSQQLLALAASHQPISTATEVAIGVYFLNGSYNGDANVLGVHLQGFPYAFIFKDVVIATGGDSVSQRYVEQATVVHEIGHAIGLVNNGLPMSSAHEDSAHPKHSNNSDCVMYWAIESRANVLTALASAILGNSLNLLGPQSLDDGRSYHP